MKIIIVSQQTKAGLRYYAYKRGILSFFLIFPLFNRISLSGYVSLDSCVSSVNFELIPDPPKKTKVEAVFDIDI